ncbi:hypothetical protein M404DRAFT_158107, partial [Pisolithus tinctorius Marx 270]
YIYGKGLNMLEWLAKDEFEAGCQQNSYYPFFDKGEWELARFLCDNLTQAQITWFLKLDWVCHSTIHVLLLTKLSVQ